MQRLCTGWRSQSIAFDLIKQRHVCVASLSKAPQAILRRQSGLHRDPSKCKAFLHRFRIDLSIIEGVLEAIRTILRRMCRKESGFQGVQIIMARDVMALLEPRRLTSATTISRLDSPRPPQSIAHTYIPNTFRLFQCPLCRR